MILRHFCPAALEKEIEKCKPCAAEWFGFPLCLASPSGGYDRDQCWRLPGAGPYQVRLLPPPLVGVLAACLQAAGAGIPC